MWVLALTAGHSEPVLTTGISGMAAGSGLKSSLEYLVYEEPSKFSFKLF